MCFSVESLALRAGCSWPSSRRRSMKCAAGCSARAGAARSAGAEKTCSEPHCIVQNKCPAGLQGASGRGKPRRLLLHAPVAGATESLSARLICRCVAQPTIARPARLCVCVCVLMFPRVEAWQRNICYTIMLHRTLSSKYLRGRLPGIGVV